MVTIFLVRVWYHIGTVGMAKQMWHQTCIQAFEV